MEENVAHEMRPEESHFRVTFSNGARLTAVWPPPDDVDGLRPSPFFYLDGPDGVQPKRPKDVREGFPSVRVIPPLTPLELEETVLSPEYVRGQVDTRRASLHFRNQLEMLRLDEWAGRSISYAEMRDQLEEWCPEAVITKLVRRSADAKQYLDVFFREPGSRVEKELSWAGDGIQVWLQIVFHVLLAGEDVDVVILDEPDLYLHADLQRRLVRLLDSHPAQVVTATHSAEIVAEADTSSLAWIDKASRHSRSLKGNPEVELLSRELGTQFNLGLARALRARTVLFVEGDDMKLLRQIAAVVGCTAFANEHRLAIVPLGGRSNWGRVESFAHLVHNFLDDAVGVFVLLDRDYLSESQVADLEARLDAAGTTPHVWRRKELESYLLTLPLIVRAIGSNRREGEQLVAKATEPLKTDTFAQLNAEVVRSRLGPKADQTRITSDHLKEFERDWEDLEYRLMVCPPKAVLSNMNRALQSDSREALSFRKLAALSTKSDVPEEMASTLLEIENAVRSS